MNEAEGPAVLWDDLPEPVRRRLLGWAADTVGAVPIDRVPAALRRVARFTPAKRAKLGAAALATAVQADDAFRSTVAAHVHGAVSDPADPITAAASAYLMALPEAAELIGAAGAVAGEAELRTRVNDLTAQLAAARAVVARWERQEREKPAEPVAPAPDQAVDKLRARLREQGSRLRELTDQLAAARSDSAAELRRAREEVTAAGRSLRLMADRAEAAKVRAERAEEQVRALRAVADEGRAVGDRRMELLLDTIRGAEAGLRTELRLAGRSVEPVDAAVAGLPTGPRLGGRSVDGSMLVGWLGLPQAHLIVDGYNVTKSGYGELTLADQRDRLVRDLAALASRTGAAVTVVFDGAAVVGHQPAGRGVRVLFSPPGVIADDVIRRLVSAEPPGRVLVVVTSDREIVADVSADGARTVPSAVLLGLWGR